MSIPYSRGPHGPGQYCLFKALAQVTILVSTAFLAEGIRNYGIGLHYSDMDPEKMPTQALISYVAGFFTILGTIWSKTSFSITLLRISTGRLRWLVWFIIISVNLVLGVSATIHWTQCWPLQKLFYYNMEGTCLPLHVVQSWQIFASGTLLRRGGEAVVLMIRACSVFRYTRYRSRIPSVENHLGRHDKQEGENRRTLGYEHGRVVCFTFPP